MGTYTWPGGRACTGVWNQGVEPDTGSWEWPDGRAFPDKSAFIDGDLEKLYQEGLLNLDKILLDEEIDRSSLIPTGGLSAYLVTDPTKKQAIYDLLIAGEVDGDFESLAGEDPKRFLGSHVYVFNETSDFLFIDSGVQDPIGQGIYWEKGEDGRYRRGYDSYAVLPDGYDAGLLVFSGLHWNETFAVDTAGLYYPLETGFEDDGW